MYFYDLDHLLERRYALRISPHALLEARKEGLEGEDILYAVLNGEIIEQYPDRNRLLILGPVLRSDLSLHVVCDYDDTEVIVVITTYIPDRPNWIADTLRGQSQEEV